jgi:hypothetical protein
MRVARASTIALSLWLTAAGAGAQAPNVSSLFAGWAPLGAYEQSALTEQGGMRMIVPTKRGNVEIAFTPESVLSSRYGAEHVDARGGRRGQSAPRFTAYTGRMRGAGKRDFAKLSYQAQTGKLQGLLRVDGTFYELEADLAAGDYLLDVREVGAQRVGELMQACGVQADEAMLGADDGGASATSPSEPTSAAATQLLEIELGTEADAPFVAQAGGAAAANARILSIVNLVNGVYETDLGLTNRVVVQRTHAGSDPYTSTNSDTLLDQFTAQFPRNVATRHDDALLFTGRDMDGSTVGIAWLDATCSPYRYGIAQNLGGNDTLTSLVAAHELGHNLGARHSGAGLMAPSINPDYDYFVQGSKDEIAYYLGRVSCLAPSAASGTNSPPTLQPVGPQLATEGQPLVIQLSASDPDGNSLSYAATPLPAGATLSASGRFEWTPPSSAAGCSATRQYDVRFSASDGAAAASELVPISVADAPMGATPVLTDPADRSVFTGVPVQLQLQASDADGDTLSYSATGLPAGASLSTSGAFAWTPASTQVGAINIGFEVADCTGRRASQSMRVDVTQRPLPHLTSISQATGWIGDTLTLSGTELSGSTVVVKIANVSASIVSRANDRVVVTAPSVGKKKRKAGAQPVVLIRDGVQSDSTLWFDYVKPAI